MGMESEDLDRMTRDGAWEMKSGVKVPRLCGGGYMSWWLTRIDTCNEDVPLYS